MTNSVGLVHNPLFETSTDLEAVNIELLEDKQRNNVGFWRYYYWFVAMMAGKRPRMIRQIIAMQFVFFSVSFAASAIWSSLKYECVADQHGKPQVITWINVSLTAILADTGVVIICLLAPFVAINGLVPQPWLTLIPSLYQLGILIFAFLIVDFPNLWPLAAIATVTLYPMYSVQFAPLWVYSKKSRRGIQSTIYFISLGISQYGASFVIAFLLHTLTACNYRAVLVAAMGMSIIGSLASLTLPPMFPNDTGLLVLPRLNPLDYARRYGALLKHFVIHPQNIFLILTYIPLSILFVAVYYFEIAYVLESHDTAGDTQQAQVLAGTVVVFFGIAFLCGSFFAGFLSDWIGVQETSSLILTTLMCYILVIPVGVLTLYLESFSLILLAVTTAFMILIMVIVLIPVTVLGTYQTRTDADGMVLAVNAMVALGYLFGGLVIDIVHQNLILQGFDEVRILLGLYVFSLLGVVTLLLAYFSRHLKAVILKRRGETLSDLLKRQHGNDPEPALDGRSDIQQLAETCQLESWYVDATLVQIKKRIGAGAFGNVYYGVWNGVPVAVKTLHAVIDEAEMLSAFLKEVSTLARLRHPNVLTFYGASVEANGSTSIVTEYCSGGCLFDILRDTTYVISGADTQRFALEISRGVSYLHALEPPILHRDLKSLNILLDERQIVKLCDFGESRSAGKEARTMTMVGTPMWTAPEVLLGVPYGLPADIYSLGIILVELITRSDPWPAGMWCAQIVAAVVKGERPALPSAVSKDVAQLIQRCLYHDPLLRLTAQQVAQRIQDGPFWDFVTFLRARAESKALFT